MWKPWNQIKPFLYKIYYKSKFEVNFPQRRWEGGFEVHIKAGNIKIGKNNNFRRMLQLRALGGGDSYWRQCIY